MRFLFFVSVIFTLFVPAILGICDYTAAAWVAAVSGVFVTIATRLDDISEIKFGPLQAKLRQAIKEANATIEQLRGIALASAKVNKAVLISESFASIIIPFTQRANYKKELDNELIRIGLSEKDIKETDEYWNKGISIIFHRRILNAVKEHLPTENVEASRIRSELHSKLGDVKQWEVATPEEFRSTLKKLSLLKPDVEKQIQEYEDFLHTKEVTNLDNWGEE